MVKKPTYSTWLKLYIYREYVHIHSCVEFIFKTCLFLWIVNYTYLDLGLSTFHNN